MAKFVSVSYLGYSPNHDLSRKTKFLTHSQIALVVQIILSKSLTFPDYIAQILASSVRLFKREFERSGLIWCGEKFDLGYQFHGVNCDTYVLYFQALTPTHLVFFDKKYALSRLFLIILFFNLLGKGKGFHHHEYE
jgi:hypothetical protein